VHRPGTPPVILTRPPGYVFQVAPGALDLHRFEAYVAQGRSAASDGRPIDAGRAYASALALWRGPALGGLGGPCLQAEAARLEELRLGVLEDRIAADLELDGAGRVLPELVGLVTAEPTRERLRGQLMVALARLGRQAEALEVYRRGRALMRDSFGLDPGPELQRLHQAILTGAEAARSERPGRATSSIRCAQPAQLPPDVGELIGRRAEVETVGTVLRAAASGAVATVAISGMPGVGKSALAVHAAHAARTGFPDGQLYAALDTNANAQTNTNAHTDTDARTDSRTDTDARTHADAGAGLDAGSQVGTSEVLARFLRALGHADVPTSLEERSSLFRSTVAGRRLLIVLDGVQTEHQLRPLLPGTPGCAVLITARARPYALDRAEHVPLDVLTPDDAVRLLEALVGAARVAADPDAAHEIVARCGRLPLAVRVAGARLAARPPWPLSTLAARLRDEAHRLDELVAGDLVVRDRFATGYAALAPADRRAFALLGAAGPADLTPAMAAPLLGSSTAEAERRLDRIAEAQLMTLADVGADGQLRYGFHELTRVYARERGEAEVPLGQRREAVRRLLAAGLAGLEKSLAGGVTRPIGLYALAPADNDGPADLGLAARVRAAPLSWLAIERPGLEAAMARAQELGLAGPARALTLALERLDTARWGEPVGVRSA
jgi:hypothetical protein